MTRTLRLWRVLLGPWAVLAWFPLVPWLIAAAISWVRGYIDMRSGSVQYGYYDTMPAGVVTLTAMLAAVLIWLLRMTPALRLGYTRVAVFVSSLILGFGIFAAWGLISSLVNVLEAKTNPAIRVFALGGGKLGTDTMVFHAGWLIFFAVVIPVMFSGFTIIVGWHRNRLVGSLVGLVAVGVATTVTVAALSASSAFDLRGWTESVQLASLPLLFNALVVCAAWFLYRRAPAV